MSCERFRDALRDVALGTEVSSELERHLDGCPRCRATLVDDRRRVQGLDDELERTLVDEPPVDLAVRVRRRIETAVAVESGRDASWTDWLSFSVRLPVVALVGFLMLWTAVLVLWLGWPDVPAVAEELSPARSVRRAVGPATGPPRYRSLEGFQPVRTMTIRLIEKKEAPQ